MKIKLKQPTLIYNKKQPYTTTKEVKPEDTTPDIRNQNQTQDNKTKMKSIFEEMMKPKPVKPSTSQPKLTQTQAKTKISGYL